MSDTTVSTVEEVMGIAKAQGLVCFIRENDRELQIDLDGDAELNKAVNLALVHNTIYIVGMLQTTSKSGGHHVYISLDRPIDPAQALIMQACLGSDPKREFLSSLRLARGAEVISALFETPAEAEKVVKWREACLKSHLNDIGEFL